MSRGHTQGFDSNAGQFARMGNPWDGEPVLKRRNRKGKRAPACRPGLPRIPERESRSESEHMLHIQAKRELAAKLAADRGSRTQKSPTLAKPAPVYQEIKPDRSTELGEWDRTRIEGEISRLERAAKTARIAAKERLGDYRAAAIADLGCLAL